MSLSRSTPSEPRPIPAHTADSLVVCAFGRPEVRRGAQPVTWAAASAQELLYYLLSSPEGRTREQILEDLWGLNPGPASANRFRVTIHRLRTALADPASVTEQYGRYQLSAAVLQASDVHGFYAALHEAERATDPSARLQGFQAAVDLYRGDYLPQVTAEWARQAREEHRAAYVHACTELFLTRCGAGDCPGAVVALQRALTADPYQGEQHHQKLMTCLSAVQDRYAAIEHYRRFLRFLHDDLHDTPMPDTVALAERIKAGERICQQREAPAPRCPYSRDGQCAARPSAPTPH
ncbi:AfsR/SARP family transcriptional regulator [Deinococcus sonorensis]|uniref:BTAD domain-containing putative transcriptional regulator n=2 Tax=Deinococcus sonorensis TaxID=309891 RepID=A0AAU7U4Y3_9DEIO